jgi:Tfp pilus assembly protein PilF
MGDAEGAVLALTHQRDQSEGPERRTVELELAAAYLHRLGKPDMALASVSRLLEGAPDDPAALAVAGELLANESTREAMATVLEKAQRESADSQVRARILAALLDAVPTGGDPVLRRTWFEELVRLQRENGEPEHAFDTVLRATLEEPRVTGFWDQAEQLARELERPRAVAEAYDLALALSLPADDITLLGQRGVAFQEEWFEDNSGVVRILERVLVVDHEAEWAFDRLKMIFDSGERWTELFALYDRAIVLAEGARKASLFEDAAQIAKDFANDSDRAILYLEQLLAMRPLDAHLVASLERLYERKGAHRELVKLLTGQLGAQSASEAQKTRGRIAELWLDDLKDPAHALAVAEELLEHETGKTSAVVDSIGLIERIMAASPPGLASAEPGTRPVRYRAAAILRRHYEKADRDTDLVRLFEVELEIATSPAELVSGHRQIALFHTKLGDHVAALEHVATLALLEPDDGTHRAELASLAAKVGRYDRLAEVLVKVAERTQSIPLRAELMVAAGDVWVTHLADEERGIVVYLNVLAERLAPPAMVVDAARKVEPLLERANRGWDLLEVLERLAALEDESVARARAWAAAARLATSFDETARAITAWEARLAEAPDAEALDSLIVLLGRAERWQGLLAALVSRSRAKESRTDDERREDYVRIANIHQERLGDLPAAIDAWTSAEEEFGPADDSTDALCALLEKTERWAALETKLASAAERATTPERRAELLARTGDVARGHGDDPEGAYASYQASLVADAGQPLARAGLLALANAGVRVSGVLALLLLAYGKTDDWRETLAITELRLSAAASDDERVAVLLESAKLAEDRASDQGQAFGLEVRAFALVPDQADVADELSRLAGATGEWTAYAAAHETALEAHLEGGDKKETFGNLPWRAAFRYRLAKVQDHELSDGPRALESYTRAAEDAPSELPIALSTIDLATRLGLWSVVANAVVLISCATGHATDEALALAEERAQSSSAWTELADELTRAVQAARNLPGQVARDLEARTAEWHRDRRGDPDLAEAAFSRALAYDVASTDLLGALANLQRRSKGRPLVDSLVRLSEATGGDLSLLREAGEVAMDVLGDRPLASSILTSLVTLAESRWLPEPSESVDTDLSGPVSVGETGSPAGVVRWALEALVRIHEADGHVERTTELLTRAARLPWPPDEARQMLHRAAALARDVVGDIDRTIEIFEGLFATDHEDRAAILALTELYQAHEKHDDLLRLRARLVEKTDEPARRVELRLASALLETSLGHEEAAIALLRANLADLARDLGTTSLLAKVLEEGKRFVDLADLYAAQADLAAAAGAVGAAAELWIQAANVAEHRLLDSEAAIRHYRRALTLEESAQSLDELARLLSLAGEHGSAAETLARLLATSPSRPTALVLRFVTELELAGDTARARAELEASAETAPDDQALRDRLVAMYTAQEAWDPLADLHRRSAMRTDEKGAKLFHLRTAADLLIRRCETPDAAIPLLEEAVVLDPDDRGSKLVLADAFVHASKFTEARALLRSIIDAFGGRRPKERGIAHYHLALLELAVGNRAQALVELDAATKIDPSNARIVRALAELAREDGQIDRAERSYRALLVALKRPEESTEDSEVVRSEVLLALSGIAAAQGQSDRARELIESALESAAKSIVEARRLETALRQQKEFPTLVRALEARLARATENDQRLEVLTELARVQDVELGHLAAAFTARQRVLALTPTSPAAHEASVALARRVDGLVRYVEDVERSAGEEERAGHREPASMLYFRAGRVHETDLLDDAGAAKLYEQSLALVAQRSPAESTPPSSRSLSKQGLAVIRTLEPVYARLGRTPERMQLLAQRIALESPLDDPKSAADARYRLAELTVVAADGALDAGLLITQALELDSDLERAEAVVRKALEHHAGDEGFLDLLETIGRSDGRDLALLDALTARMERPNASADVAREAVATAMRLGDQPRAEALLSKLVSRSEDHDVGWALEELAALREAADDARAAVEWKRRAAEVSTAADARRLRVEMAKLMDGPLHDVAGAAAVYELLFDEDPTDRSVTEPMLAALRKHADGHALVRILPRVIDQATTEEERSLLRLERVRLMDAAGDRSEAISALADLVMDDPNHGEAARLLADLFEQTGRMDDLRELLGRQIDAAKDRQDAKQVESLSLRRAALLAETDPEEARAILNSALDWTPESREVLGQLLRLLEEPGMEGERLDVKERLLRTLDAADAERAALELAELRLAEGSPDAAERALEIGFRQNPSSTVLYDRLESGYRTANATEKLADLVAISARGLSDPHARVARLREVAKLYAALPDPARAAAVLAEAFALVDSDATLATELIAAQVSARDIAGALTVLARALELSKDDVPQRATLLLERATLRLDQNEDEASAADLTTVARLGVSSLAPALEAQLERVRSRAEARGDAVLERAMRLELATARAEGGDLDAARPLISELLRRDPKDRDGLRLLARIEERAERWDAATVAYRRLIPLEEGDLAVDTALRLADACEKAGRLADARGALERTRMAAPNDQALRLRLERLYESVGAFRELAEMSFNDAREAADDDARCSHLKRAGALLLQDGTDADAAIDALVDAHALSDADVECTLLLADAYTVAGRTADAQTLITAQIAARAGRRSPELASLYHRLARVANVLGDRPGELAALTSGLEADAQNGFVAAELASAALEAGDVELATRALRAVTLLKNPGTSHISKGLAFQYLGEIARQQGDPKRAMLLLKRAIEDDPTLETAQRLIEELRAEGS